MAPAGIGSIDTYTRNGYAIHITIDEQREGGIRTNIVIDDQLMQQAMLATGLSTKKSVVEAGLHLLVQVKAQTGLRRLRGQVSWEGNLDEMRQGRSATLRRKTGA